LDVDVQYVDQGHVSEKVTASVEQLAAAGCQGIIICNSSDTEMTSAIKTCNDNKVYLAQFFRVISQENSADIYQAAKDSDYYIGAVQGIPICFDAKECAADTFPLQNVHEHQVSFMEKYEKQQGISFLIIYYSQKETLYYMRFEELLKFWKRAQSGGRKSIRFEELSPEYFMALKNHCFVPYLDYIQKDFL